MRDLFALAEFLVTDDNSIVASLKLQVLQKRLFKLLISLLGEHTQTLYSIKFNYCLICLTYRNLNRSGTFKY